MTIKKSLSWMALGQVSSFVLQFAGSVVLARYLTPYETGIYAVALATVGALSMVQALGLQALVVREEVLTPEIVATTFTINALISLALALAILGLGLGAGAYFGDPGVRHVLVALSIVPLFGIFTFLPTAMLQREGQFRSIAVRAMLATMAATLCTALLALNGFSYMSAAYGQWVHGIVSVITLSLVARQHARFRISFVAWRRIASFGGQMLLVSGLTGLSQRASDVILGRTLGLSALGIYTRASGLNTLVWNGIALVTGRVMLTEFATIHRSGVPLRDRYIVTVDMMTATLWPAFAGLAILARPFIRAVYGENWVAAANPLLFLALASIVQTAITMTWELFAATDNLAAQTRVEIKRALFALTTFTIGCLISLEAAAGARVLDALFALLLYRPHLDRMTGTRLRDFVPIYLRNGLLTLLAVAPALVLMTAYRFSPDVPIAAVIGVVPLGGLLWLAGLAALRHPLFGEVRKLLARRRLVPAGQDRA